LCDKAFLMHMWDSACRTRYIIDPPFPYSVLGSSAVGLHVHSAA